MVTEEIRYNVVCIDCGQVFTPVVRSSLWWRAKKRDEQGYLDALPVTGEECGCIKQPAHSEAHFRVFGYDDMCMDFDIPCNTFAIAVQKYRQLDRAGCVVFINGVSDAVEDKLRQG